MTEASLDTPPPSEGEDAARPASARPESARTHRRRSPIVPEQNVAGRALIFVIAIMTFLSCLTFGGVTLVREAAEEVSAAGTRLITIVSDLPHPGREAYVGLDNQAAGRTAALLLGRFCRSRDGSVALVAGSRNYRAHAEREMGFLSLLEEAHPGLRVVGMREGHDDRNENYRHALSLLDQNPDLVGIYNVGGSSDGIGRALRERDKGDVVFIGHGMTADTRRLLIEGTLDAVINSDPDQIIAQTLARFSRSSDMAPGGDPRHRPIGMEVIFRENIPPQG